ncbi:YdeI/OmpD-associated family protein [Candidatus Microgenomates bacterium]|nr:YdeI/OmpD-associated family protein [Candidatus Microgenomates bacterium]
MLKKEATIGVTPHRIPIDLRKALATTPTAQTAWKDITPLARNEWICWIISAKKLETRKRRVERLCVDLTNGKRRPCCWAGCPHR